MKKTIVSTNRLMILAVMMVMTISANAARPLVACYQRDARTQVISDADKDSVLPLHMPFKKDTGNSQKFHPECARWNQSLS